MHYFRISGEVEERLLSPTHTHTHSHAQRERECESARVREREAERNTREPVHAFIERAHTFIQHSRMHTQHTFFPFQGRLKNACTALRAHPQGDRDRGSPTHIKHPASHTAGLPKHLCCAGALQSRRRKGACARGTRGRLHHSDGKILSLATQKTLIPEFCGLGPPLDPRVPSGPANLFPSVLRDSIGCSESRGSRRMQRGAPFAVGQSTAQRNTKCVVHTQWSTRTTTRQRVAQ